VYECASWPLKLRAKLRLRVFENRVLRKIFGPNSDEIKASGKTEWGPLRSVLFTKHYLDNQIKMNEMGRAREVHTGIGVKV